MWWNGIYRHRFENKKQLMQKNKLWQVLVKYFFQKWVSNDDYVVDIAAGNCEFINHVRARRKVAFDLNSDVLNNVAEEVEAINASLCDRLELFEKEKADVVFASNIFEHLSDKEEFMKMMKCCAEILTHSTVNGRGQAGKLLVLQPNIKYVKERYWDFVDHQLPLTDKTIIEGAELCGFRLVKNISKFLPYTTKSLFPQWSVLVWLYLKLMPLSGWLFGAQSFIVLEKK